MARVLISYASSDRERAQDVHYWLVSAGHEVFLAQRLTDGIGAGDKWEQRLHERLRWASKPVEAASKSCRYPTHMT